MNRQPIDLDDPRLTAYALGELPSYELDEFESRLEISPLARKELIATREMMALLEEGFQTEWTDNAGIQEIEETPTTVVKGDFGVLPSIRRQRRGLAIAAAAALFLGVGALFIQDKPASNDHSWASADTAQLVNSVDVDSSDVRVPELRLAAEVADFDALGASGGSVFDGNNFPVDASYLEAGQVIKTSYRETDTPQLERGELNPSWLKKQMERVDSYFTDHVRTFEVETGAGDSRPAFPAGFEPAIIRSSPSASRDSVRGQYQDMQNALSEIAEEVGRLNNGATPQQVERLRLQLGQLVNQSEEIGSQLSNR